MKRINHPVVPDVSNLRALAKHTGLSSHPALGRVIKPILSSYVAYRNVNGDSTAVGAPSPLVLDEALRTALISHYLSPPVAIEPFICQLRDRSSPDVCPMCGSFGTGTLDHIFPKKVYPELAFFSKNLVPACICNTKRRNCVAGNQSGRVLHPYFDSILSTRLVRAVIQPSPEAGLRSPSIGLEIILDRSDENYDIVRFHVDNVIMPTQLLAYFDASWPKIARQPHRYFILQRGQVSLADLAQAAAETLLTKDEHYGTMNNWESMLFAGIAYNTDVLNYLAERVNGLREGRLNLDNL